MSVEFKIYDTDGNLVFDVSKHRLIRYQKTITTKAGDWYRAPNNSVTWWFNYPGISPQTHMCTSKDVTVLTDKFQWYNQYNSSSYTPTVMTLELYAI